MTEAGWLKCTDPEQMLKVLSGKRGLTRKRRLFACACCRRLWDLLGVEYRSEILEVAERYADGLVGDEEREAARRLHRRPDPASPSLEGEWWMYTVFRELLAHPYGFRESCVWMPIAGRLHDQEFIADFRMA
jgi:hypothetical protein